MNVRVKGFLEINYPYLLIVFWEKPYILHSSHDIPLSGGAGEAGEGSGGGQVDAGGAQASARRGGEVSHSVGDPDPDPDPQDPHVFGPPGSGSADPDPHQNTTDPQHWLVIFSDTLSSFTSKI
jgi:hypothetical protein